MQQNRWKKTRKSNGSGHSILKWRCLLKKNNSNALPVASLIKYTHLKGIFFIDIVIIMWTFLSKDCINILSDSLEGVSID